MLYQPTIKLVMTDDVKFNQTILQEEAWQRANQIEHALTSDFVIDPQNQTYMYAPGWQKTPGLDWDNVYVSYFTLRGLFKQQSSTEANL